MKFPNYILFILLLSANNKSLAQNQYFHTVTKKNSKPIVLFKEKQVASDSLASIELKDHTDYAEQSDKTDNERFSSYFTEELEKLIEEYEKIKETKMSTSKTRKIYHFYEGQSKVLNIPNLIEVMLAVDMKEPIYVLAQAILETGHFSSKVCRNYNNLFGLFDSKAQDYFRFERWEDSVIGYIKFIQYRYQGGSYVKFLDKIGYAEDPHYTTKVKKLAKHLYKTIKTQYFEQQTNR